MQFSGRCLILVLLAGCLCACGPKAKDSAPSQPPRTLEFSQLEQRGQLGRWFAQGEQRPFNGTAIQKRGGHMVLQVPIVNGQREGRELTWDDQGREGFSRLWEKGRVARLLPPPAMEKQANQWKRERDELDRTLWRQEVRAQAHEAVFVKLWDELRAAKDKWAPLQAFRFGKVQVGAAGQQETLDAGIRRRKFSMPREAWSHDRFQEWLRQQQAAGWAVVETEWHHERFESEARRSHIRFVVHAVQASQKRRVILRGTLEVSWDERAKGPFPEVLKVAELTLLERTGPPPFRAWLQVAPPARVLGGQPTVAPLLVHDLDRDGRPEIVLAGANLVYRQHDGVWEDPEPWLKFAPRGIETAVLADFTGDGLVDALCLPEGSGPALFRGGPGGVFDSAPTYTKLEFQGHHRGAALSAGDIDGDGDLDAWLAQYKAPYTLGQMPTPYYDANDGFPSFLLVNDGQGRFTDETETRGLATKRWRRTFSSSLADLDGDHDLDLVVVSDFAGMDLYRNDGKGYFTDVTGALRDQRFSFGMAHVIADLDHDGRQDIYMIGMGSTTARRLAWLGMARQGFAELEAHRLPMGYGNRLLLGTANGWAQASFNDQLARTGWSWGVTAADFDNDSDLDLYVANGNMSRKTARDYCTHFWRHDIYTGTSREDPKLDLFFGTQCMSKLQTMSWNGFEHNVLYLSSGGRTFVNAAFLLGVSFEFDARGVVGADLDADGRQDLLVVERGWDSATGRTPQTLHVLRNQWPDAGNWIGARLAEHGPGRSPQGAKVTVRLAGGARTALVVSGDSYRAQHPTQKHFGLGMAKAVVALEARWPDGTVTRLDHPAINQYHELRPK